MLFVREAEGLYKFGGKKIIIKIEQGNLIIRVGGGYVEFEEFIKLYAHVELAKAGRLVHDSPTQKKYNSPKQSGVLTPPRMEAMPKQDNLSFIKKIEVVAPQVNNFADASMKDDSMTFQKQNAAVKQGINSPMQDTLPLKLQEAN